MPGLGKTQLALKFATLAFKQSRYPYIFWMSAGSVEKLNRDFVKLGDLLRLPGRCTSDNVAKSVIVRAWLEDTANARSWLLILDNVTQEAADMLRDVLPRRNGRGRFLFTTRTEKMAASLVMVPGWTEKIALQPPCIDDAIAVLLAGAEMDRECLEQAELADIESVIKSVGKLPLAIDQAASYMRESGCSPREMLDIYRHEGIDEVGE